MRSTLIVAGATLILACGGLSDTHINKDINVADGEHRNESVRSVNGTITIGNEASVEGNCTTVNGDIYIGENSEIGEASCVNGSISIDRNTKAREVSSVNGSISLGGEVQIDGDVSTVNGNIGCKSMAEIEGSLETVNGEIRINETMVKGDMKTVNGDLTLAESSLVRGNIVVDRHNTRSRMKEYKKLVITIDGKSKVKGNIEVKGDEPNVTVILAAGGEVLGDIINAEVIRK